MLIFRKLRPILSLIEHYLRHRLSLIEGNKGLGTAFALRQLRPRLSLILHYLSKYKAIKA